MPLVLPKRQSILVGMENIVEIVDKKTLDAMLLSDKLRDKWGEDSRNAQFYENERQMFASCNKKYNKTLRGVIVKYTKGRNPWGRPFTQLGSTAFRKEPRNTLLKDEWCDFDL